MGAYTVYRVDYTRQVTEPVGTVAERRKKERGRNVEALLKLAQSKYAKSPLDSHIYILPVLSVLAD